MVIVEDESTAEEAMGTALACGYSRIPVVGDGGIDDVVGIVYAKDLMRAASEDRDAQPISALRREAMFVPETKKVAELMREMQAKKQHMAIVVDEYGGTAGLVTLEDLIEELVGEIVDEYDVEDPFVERLPNGDLRVNGRLSLDELNERLDLDLPTGDWDTVGGLLFNLLGHVPDEGEAVEVDGHRLRAERVTGRRIGRVRITPRPPHREPLVSEVR
jgi:CBS domain containing-hemolysin-like protein